MSTLDSSSETFTGAINQLETIVGRLQQETLPLETSLELFEAGLASLKTCQTRLGDIQGKISVLNAQLEAIAFEPEL